MSDIPWELVLAIIGVLVPIAAFLWEFVLTGRKRLGYRVQMDTTPTDVSKEHAGAWKHLESAEGRLVDPSFALLRIENIGSAPVDDSDYSSPNDVGLKVKFPGRKVGGMVVTELSDNELAEFFVDGAAGLGTGSETDQDGVFVAGVVKLPKVKLNPGAHYKVLVVLERAGENGGTFPEPYIDGLLKGAGRGKIAKTKGQTGTPRWVVGLISLLLTVALAEPFLFELTAGRPAPLECASGNLTITGSTAFEPVLREAAASYTGSCPDSTITFDTTSSVQGLQRLNHDRSPDVLAFTDGVKEEQMPALLPRPMAFVLFTVVISKDAGVQDLTGQQLRDVFAGRVSNWSQVGGANLPVVIVDRESQSGTRRTFENRVLGGEKEPGETMDYCRAPATPTNPVARCRQPNTPGLLNAVSLTPGSVGYSELQAAAGRSDLALVRINGQAASLEAADHHAYPFWETENAYTYGEPRAGSLAASFMRYLTNQIGADIIRSHGNRPCADLENPVLCHPED